MSGILCSFIVTAPSGSIWDSTPIGTSTEGGFFAGLISTAANGVADFALIVAPVSSGENSSKQAKNSNTDSLYTDSVIDGPTNSVYMDFWGSDAAEFCNDLTIGGYSDWYLPAKNELEVCYYNLKPTTQSNNTSSGSNSNAVPSHSNYTSGSPAQTSVSDFQTGNTEAFTASEYWSSTQYNASANWRQSFYNGLQDGGVKTGYYRVRAIRRVAV